MDTESTATVTSPVENPALSGFEDGHQLPDGSVVRNDTDDNGNVIGWHKEPATGEEHPVASADGEDQPITQATDAPTEEVQV